MIAAFLGSMPRSVWLAMASVAVVAGSYWAGGEAARTACEARIAVAEATLLFRIQEDADATTQKALDARRRVERDHDAGRLPDADPYRRD
ncbi:hypothetical protein [Amorphus sp. 3PC139-8]|uniref:hypothetical protein n=1 Tax=Amorphus sp. 3PC139-8 TaxID=2735676 RepID=UPI00345CE8CF